MRTLFCPVCKSKLVVTHQDRYQDLGEHVSNPNREPSMKDGYQCSDSTCFTHFLGCTWINDGSLYMSKPYGMGWSMSHTLLEERCEEGIDSAIGSWQRSYDIVEKKRKKYTININLFFIQVQIEPQYRQMFDNEPENMAQSNGMEKKEEYRWKFHRRKWNWFKKDKSGRYVSFTPIWEIVKWKNSDFKENYHRALQRNKEALDKLMKIYEDTAYWNNNQKEPRFWYRVANKILRLKYKGRFEILKHTTI